MKTFTLDEAQSLLPVLESLLKRAVEGKEAAEQVEAGLSELARRIYLSGGMTVDVVAVTKQRAEMESHLLDFPCRVDDQVVLLCWRMGETSIEHWHTLESGFQGRQPLDDRFRRRTNSGGRPN